VAKPWDNTMKLLIRSNPRAFVRWLIPRARYICERSSKLEQEALDVDALLEVIIDGQRMLLHIEFQTYNDDTMDERLMRYNVLARMKYGLPVLSCVIYLLKDGTVPSSPLRWNVPSGQLVLEFHFLSIELAKLSQDDVLGTGLVGLVPLSLFTRDGASRQAIQRMFRVIHTAKDIEVPKKRALELLGFTLAALVLKRQNTVELDWLIRRYREMHDFLSESPIYQEILQEGIEKGFEKGRDEELQKRLASLRLMLVTFAQAKSPQLKRLAQEQGAHISDPRILEDLTVKVGLAHTPEEAREHLLRWRKTYRGLR
jgi:predicted transposase YdaD